MILDAVLGNIYICIYGTIRWPRGTPKTFAVSSTYKVIDRVQLGSAGRHFES